MFDQFELFVRSRPNCEFLKNNLHGQPVNLITNLAFFICGWKVYKLLRKHKINKKEFWWLFYGIMIIGLGSSIHHYHSNLATLIIDGLPMLGVMYLTVYLLARYLFKANQSKALTVTLGYILLIGAIMLLLNNIFRPVIVLSLSSQLVCIPMILISARQRQENTKVLITATVFFLLAAAAAEVGKLPLSHLRGVKIIST